MALPFEAAGDQAAVIGSKGGVGQGKGTQGRQVEHAPELPTAAFGQLDLPFPFPALAHFQIQTGVGHRLIDAVKARDIAQLGAQHGNGLPPKFGYLAQGLGTLIALEETI